MDWLPLHSNARARCEEGWAGVILTCSSRCSVCVSRRDWLGRSICGTAHTARRGPARSRFHLPLPKRKPMPCSQYRIAHVMPWAAVAGTEHATLRIARATGSGQFRHVMFCLDDAPAVAAFFADAGFETFSYSRIEPSYRHAGRYLRASCNLARSFKRNGIDLVHCADVAAAFDAGLAGRLAGARVLCHVRNRHEEMTPRDRSFLRFVHKFAFVSADTRRRFAYQSGTRHGVVIYDGIDVSGADDMAAPTRATRLEFGISGEIKLIGMLARVAPQKDFTTLAKAAAIVLARCPNVRFLIVGNHERENRAHYEEV